MNRRESLKVIGVTGLSAGLLLDACKPQVKTENKTEAGAAGQADRQPIEVERDKKLNSETFFTPHEMATITVLGDIIIPKDAKSGSASDAEVPAFIEFIAKDKPEHQVPLRGGLRWLDLQSTKRHNQPFKDCSPSQQLALVDEIAYPETAKPEMMQGVAFFNRLRDLVATGFFTSKMGIDDLGYVGNQPNRWEGVPADIVKQYGLENVSFDLFRTGKTV